MGSRGYDEATGGVPGLGWKCTRVRDRRLFRLEHSLPFHPMCIDEEAETQRGRVICSVKGRGNSLPFMRVRTGVDLGLGFVQDRPGFKAGRSM